MPEQTELNALRAKLLDLDAQLSDAVLNKKQVEAKAAELAGKVKTSYQDAVDAAAVSDLIAGEKGTALIHKVLTTKSIGFDENRSLRQSHEKMLGTRDALAKRISGLHAERKRVALDVAQLEGIEAVAALHASYRAFLDAFIEVERMHNEFKKDLMASPVNAAQTSKKMGIRDEFFSTLISRDNTRRDSLGEFIEYTSSLAVAGNPLYGPHRVKKPEMQFKQTHTFRGVGFNARQ
jgi:hypothetical protein